MAHIILYLQGKWDANFVATTKIIDECVSQKESSVRRVEVFWDFYPWADYKKRFKNKAPPPHMIMTLLGEDGVKVLPDGKFRENVKRITEYLDEGVP